MKHIAPRPIVVLCFALFASAAHAEMGPCKPQTLENGEFLICGSGAGAAMVIPDTVSPNRKFALAWRAPGAVPTDEEPGEDNEMLLVRIADGAILAKAGTEYFNTGKMRANRKSETADWSPDSRMVIRHYDTRYDTEAAYLFVIAPDGFLAGELDLLPTIQSAVSAAVKRRRKDPEGMNFSMTNKKQQLTNDGTFRFRANYFVPKGDDNFDYKVTVKIEAAAKKSAAPSARVTAIAAVKG